MKFTEAELISLSQALRLRCMVMVQTAVERKHFENIQKTQLLQARFQRELRKVRGLATQGDEDENES
jgi:Leu/Phe-tRNA-protein transferase